MLFLPGDTGFRIFEHSGRPGRHDGVLRLVLPGVGPKPRAARGADHRASFEPGAALLPDRDVARCLENRVFAVTTNRYGTEELAEQRLTTGASQMITPRGERLLHAPIEGDSASVVEIDPAAANDKHVTAGNDLFADRRPEMYA